MNARDILINAAVRLAKANMMEVGLVPEADLMRTHARMMFNKGSCEEDVVAALIQIDVEQGLSTSVVREAQRVLGLDLG